MIVITGATGQLGRLVIEELLKSIQPSEITAAVRNLNKADDLSLKGINVVFGDYDKPESFDKALKGADKLLLISASEVGKRTKQHGNVINAAKKNNVKLIAYTSILHADTSPLPLSEEHKNTEETLKKSGIPHVLLRNSWYTENYMSGVPTSLQYGEIYGSAGDGKISSASRADYAKAAAAVLQLDNQEGKIYELAGDESYTLSDLAKELSHQTGKEIKYINLKEEEYSKLLEGAGLPQPIAQMLAESDTGASKGGLYDNSKTLSKLTGVPTTKLSESVKAALNS